MNTPAPTSPAIVAERGAQRLPRLPLLLLCAAYLLPGLFGRDPWRNADLTAYGFMASIAQGHAPWWKPAIAGIAAGGGPLPYWVGALAIKSLPWLDPALAARLPYALMLALVFALVWYSAFNLARTEAAQPVAFAFGGEAQAEDYARALADGALLALIASLGLLQLGHETTPELMQLMFATLWLFGLSAAPYHAAQARVAVLVALPGLAAAGAPAVALVLAALGLLLCARSSYAAVRRLIPWLLVAGALAALAAWTFHAWAWRVERLESVRQVLSLFAWFCWPAWPLALWTVWRWRMHWQRRHIFVPLACTFVPATACVLMGGSDRALLLALPPLAVLAAFALPTLKRSLSSAIDWFSVFFFTAVALFVWLYYLSMQTGAPAQPLANLRRLFHGFEPSFNALALLLAVLGTLCWAALVRWRTARHRHAFWKSLALPAGGVALCWLMVMTLGLPLANYTRSNSALVGATRKALPEHFNCLAAPGQPLATLAALEFQGHWAVHADETPARSGCEFALRQPESTTPAGWADVAAVRGPTDHGDSYVLMRRAR
ncbi:MAG: hypothetical protein JO370_15090 [Paucibacter sp.]|nr:hypothetical protein [Roseateles sp.]